MNALCGQSVAQLGGKGYLCQRRGGHEGAHSPDPDASLGNDLDLPFEAVPPGFQFEPQEGDLASGLIVMAGALPVAGLGTLPVLIYRFAKPDGSGYYKPLMLVVDEDQMTKLAQLVASATAAAIKAAS